MRDVIVIPAILQNADPDNLPYFVLDSERNRIRVCFRQLDDGDVEALRGTDWRGAVFRDVWLSLAGRIPMLKLVRSNDSADEILGLLKLGKLDRPGGPLRFSLLEVAPSDQATNAMRIIRGIGTVMIARLVAQSVTEGGSGKIIVVYRPGTAGFYKHIGFREVRHSPEQLAIEPGDAHRLVARVTE